MTAHVTGETTAGALTLRPATANDAAFLQELGCSVRLPEFSALPLAPAALDALLRMQCKAQQMGYARDFPHAVCSVVERGGRPVGRMLVDTSAERIHLVDIALLAAERGRGIGTALLQQLLETADRQRLPIRLHVRPDSPAGALYARVGFRAVSGDEVLILMERPCSVPEEVQGDMAASDAPCNR